MKMSNKLLLGFYALVILSFTSFVVLAKSSLIVVEKLEGSGVIQEIDLGEMNTNELKFSDYAIEYILDPNSTRVVAKLDTVLLSKLNNPIDLEQIQLDRILDGRYSMTNMETQKVIVGTKAYDDLTISMSNFSKVSAIDTLHLKSLTIAMSGSAVLDLKLDCNNLIISASNFSELNLEGDVNSVVMNASGSAAVQAGNLQSKQWQFNMSNFAKATINAEDAAQGNCSNSSTLKLVKKPTNQNINTSQFANVYVE